MRRLNKIVKQISEDPLFDNKDWFALQSDLKNITRWKHLEPILDRLPQQYMRRITSYLIKNFRLKGFERIESLKENIRSLEFCYHCESEEHDRLKAKAKDLKLKLKDSVKRVTKLEKELDSWENPRIKSFEEIIKNLMKG